MANEKEPLPGTRGWRADQLRKAIGVDRTGFAELLAAVAKRHGLDAGGKWTQSRVSRLLLSRQPIPLDDAASVVLLAREREILSFGWDWFVLGIEAAPATTVQAHITRGPRPGQRHYATVADVEKAEKPPKKTGTDRK